MMPLEDFVQSAAVVKIKQELGYALWSSTLSHVPELEIGWYHAFSSDKQPQ